MCGGCPDGLFAVRRRPEGSGVVGSPATSGASGPSAASTTSTVDPISPDTANSLIVPKNDVAELVGSTLDYEESLEPLVRDGRG